MMSKLEDKLIDTFDKLEGYLTEMTPMAYELAVRGAFYGGLTHLIGFLTSAMFLVSMWIYFYRKWPKNESDDIDGALRANLVGGLIFIAFFASLVSIGVFANLHPVIDPESYLVWRMIE